MNGALALRSMLCALGVSVLSRASHAAAEEPALPLPSFLESGDAGIYRGSLVAPEVEKLYERGLEYLASAQTPDGSFPGNYGAEPATPALVLLALLAHGDDPNHGRYAALAGKCVRYLLDHQDDATGYIGNTMYNHAFSALALAEAYGALLEPRVGPALKKALDLILSSQAKNRFKAWRYQPDTQEADSTVSGACFVALIAGRNAGFRVPDAAIEGALKFYADCQSPGSGSIAYLPGSGSNGGATTAIGVAVFAYAREKERSTFVKALKELKEPDPNNGANYPFYFEYYASQALFQSDLKTWETWNGKRVRQLVDTQAEDGSWDAGLGPAISTAFGLLSIALNYRYLPIYER